MALAFVLGGALHAKAADDDDEDTFEQKIIKKILGGDDGAQIDYRERSPLVVPPQMTLPPPETASVANPAWPKDAQHQPKKKKEPRRARSEYQADENRPLTPDELNRPGARAGQGRVTQPGDERPFNRPLSPMELGASKFFDLFKSKKEEEVATYPGEPPRTSMISPPAGYLTPAPTQPYGLTDRKEAPKPYDPYLDKGSEPKW